MFVIAVLLGSNDCTIAFYTLTDMYCFCLLAPLASFLPLLQTEVSASIFLLIILVMILVVAAFGKRSYSVASYVLCHKNISPFIATKSTLISVEVPVRY